MTIGKIISSMIGGIPGEFSANKNMILFNSQLLDCIIMIDESFDQFGSFGKLFIQFSTVQFFNDWDGRDQFSSFSINEPYATKTSANEFSIGPEFLAKENPPIFDILDFTGCRIRLEQAQFPAKLECRSPKHGFQITLSKQGKKTSSKPKICPGKLQCREILRIIEVKI
jgi:hypothetical protein